MPDPSLLEDEAIDGIVTALKKTTNGLWSDLGNWASLHEKLRKDENGNAAVEGVKFFECSNCVVHAEDVKKVVIQGLDGYILSEKGGQILVCKRGEEQRIKEFSS